MASQILTNEWPMTVLIPLLPKVIRQTVLQEILTSIRKITDKKARIKQLIELMPFLIGGLREIALQEFDKLRDIQ